MFTGERFHTQPFTSPFKAFKRTMLQTPWNIFFRVSGTPRDNFQPVVAAQPFEHSTAAAYSGSFPVPLSLLNPILRIFGDEKIACRFLCHAASRLKNNQLCDLYLSHFPIPVNSFLQTFLAAD
jgi:hypothetical protein